jgi:hypothetical protein
MNRSLVALLCGALVALPAVGGAQALSASDNPSGTVAPAAAEALPGPRVVNERVGVAPVIGTDAMDASTATGAQPRMGESMAMMVVGGAALVAGLIIGGGPGTVLALGGAVIGLIGLYQYLR